jgi:hypothetical protein
VTNAEGEGEAVVCLPAGDYSSLMLSGAHTANVTIEPNPGSLALLAGVTVAAQASNITIHDFSIGGGVSIGAGASHITVDHNDIDGEGPGGDGEGVETLSVNCSAANAPKYTGCTSTPPITYLTISNNRIHGYGHGSEDAIHLNNWHHVRVTANDFYNLEETENHTDALQSVWGGSDLVFDHNYEHDNQSQGFFIKDGDVSQVNVTDNLFLRNNNGGLEENNIQVFNTAEFTMTHNTSWAGQGDLVRAENSSLPLDATVEHNLGEVFSDLHESGPEYHLTEDYNIFREPPWTFTLGAHSAIVKDPEFTGPASDDYRLKSNPSGIGVDWAPSEFIYGPTGN